MATSNFIGHEKAGLRFPLSNCGPSIACSEKILYDASLFDDISDLIEEELVTQTMARIALGQQETQSRVRPHLGTMCAYLDGFENAGDI
jgi:hypothetical protein